MGESWSLSPRGPRLDRETHDAGARLAGKKAGTQSPTSNITQSTAEHAWGLLTVPPQSVYFILSSHDLTWEEIPRFSPKRWEILAVVQSLSCSQLFATPRTAARQASLSFTISWSLLKLTSVESVMPSNHFILPSLIYTLILLIVLTLVRY